MTSDPWSEAIGMFVCGLIVAAAVVVLMALGGWLNWRFREPIVPSRKPWLTPWNGFDIVLLFIIVLFAIPLLAGELLGQTAFFSWVYSTSFDPPSQKGGPTIATSASLAGGAAAVMVQDQLDAFRTIQNLWAGLLALPLQLGSLWLLRVALYPNWHSSPFAWRALPARLVLVSRAWLVLTPIVFLVHMLAVGFSAWLGSTPEEHPLAKLGVSRPAIDWVLLVLQACVIAPLIEETFCRGILLPWAARRMHRSGIVLGIAASFIVMATWKSETMANRFTAIAFAGGLVACWVAYSQRLRGKREAVRVREQGGIYASAAFFAALHSSVWPSPVPLFVLGLGLGWLAQTTRGVFVPIVVHGLFNAVSVMYILRGVN